MKNSISWLILTTVLLVAVTAASTLNLSFTLVFIFVVVGQGCLLYAVYRVLKDPYQTDKTFEDFYEDRPDLGE